MTKLVKVWLLSLGLILLLPTMAWAVSANDIVGIWTTEESKSQVKISAQGSSFVGKILSLKDPLRDGKPKTDLQNPKPALRKRPIVGLNILSGFTFDKNYWTGGKIYNPEDGKEYSCEMRLKDSKTLEVRGYVVNPLLGKTQIWTR